MSNVFSSRNFRLVFFGALVSELGALLYSFAVSFYILEITNNNAFLQGLYLALCGAVLLLFTPIGGVFGDRFNKAKIMFTCDYMKGALIIAATVLIILFRSNMAHLIILFAIGIVGNGVSGIFNPASGALLPHIVPEDKLQQANSYFAIKSSAEGILGIILAGILYTLLPIQVLFMIVGICFILSGVSEMFIRYDFVKSDDKMTVKLALSDMKEGFVYLTSRKAILALVLAILFINFFFAPITSNFLPYFVKTDIANAPTYLFKSFIKPEMWISVFSVLMGLTSLVASFILSSKEQEDKCGRKVAKRLFIEALLVVGLTLSYVIFVANNKSINAFLIILSLGILVVGFILSFINIPISTVLMRVVDKDKLSKVTSILGILSQGLIPIASVITGAILQGLGSSFLLAFCSAGFLVTSIVLMLNKKVREI